jgi:hypothetical protein
MLLKPEDYARITMEGAQQHRGHVLSLQQHRGHVLSFALSDPLRALSTPFSQLFLRQSAQRFEALIPRRGCGGLPLLDPVALAVFPWDPAQDRPASASWESAATAATRLSVVQSCTEHR